jgi:hypothetical protein
MKSVFFKRCSLQIRCRMIRSGVRIGTVVLLAATVTAGAQTRTAEIEAAREEKASTVRPENVSGLEGAMLQIKQRKILERISYGYNGLRVQVGNMATGSGFAGGPQFFREDLASAKIRVSVSALISTKTWQKYDASLVAPKLAGDRLSLAMEATRRDYLSLDFYGIGPDSVRGGRTAYHHEDMDAEGIAAVQPIRHFLVGGSFGWLWVNIGRRERDNIPNTETVFDDVSAPGLAHQTNFLHPSFFGQIDYRDNPAGPKSGGNYVSEYTWYNDQAAGEFSFRRWDIDIQQYVPFFNKTRRFALRARLSMTETDKGNRTPFYLLPRLGGSDDLRGFRPFRFADRNAVVYNAEYRWEIFSGLDGALFCDAGKVMPHRGYLSFSDLEVSSGFGFRFNVRNQTFIRLDVGFSHEGVGVWVKFNDAFLPRLFGAGTRQPLY